MFPPSNEYYNVDGLVSGRHEIQSGGDWRFLDSGRDYPPVQGWRNGPWVDNESDWISFDFPYAIRSDGTLWNFASSETSVQARIEGHSSDYAPIQVGVDSDWRSICNKVLLKTDGSMWSIGNQATGRGVRFSGGDFEGNRTYHTASTNFGRAAFRAVISSPISAVELFNYGTNGYRPAFTKSPTLSFYARALSSNIPSTSFGYYSYSPQDLLTRYDSFATPVVGSGAVVEHDWKGQIYQKRITAGGSGYTSPPLVSFVPQDGEVDTGSQFAAVLSSVDTEGFTVSDQGQGYTYATATDPYTDATASANIESGKIISWSLTSRGRKSRNLNEQAPQGVLAAVTGDGTGATALCVPATASVVGLREIQNPACWTKPPLVTLSGGGGSGATAEIIDLYGHISKITVTSEGSGYTVGATYAIGVAADGVGVGYVILRGGPVVRIDGLPSGEVCGNLGSEAMGGDGVVSAFTVPNHGNIYFDNRSIHSADIVGAAGKTVPLVVSITPHPTIPYQKNVVYTLPKDAGGFGTEKPIVRIYLKSTYLGTPNPAITANETTASVLLSQYALGGSFLGTGFNGDPVCGPPYQYETRASITGLSLAFDNVAYFNLDSGFAGWTPLTPSNYPNPVPATGSLSFTGPQGSSLEIYFVDGIAFQKSRANKVVGGGSVDQPFKVPPATSVTVSGTVSWFEGITGYTDVDLSRFYDDAFLSTPRWTPASSPLVAQVYCSLSDSRFGGGRAMGSAVAFGVSYPEMSSSGQFGYRTVSLTDGGAMYRSEPDVTFCFNNSPYPVRIGSKTWKSVSYTGTRWIAVDNEGTAFHWGTYGDINKPTPIGRGARVIFNSPSYRGIEPFYNGGNTFFYGFLNVSWLEFATGISAASAGGGLSWRRLIVDRPQHGTSACGGSGNVIACSRDLDYSYTSSGQTVSSCKVLGTLTHTLGLGYTEVPKIRYIEIDSNNPVGDVSVELVGPEKFVRAEGCFLIDENGRSWDTNSQQSWDANWPLYSSTVTSKLSRTLLPARAGTGSVSRTVAINSVFREYDNYISLVDLNLSGSGGSPATLTYSPGTRITFYRPTTGSYVVDTVSEYTQCDGTVQKYDGEATQTASYALELFTGSNDSLAPFAPFFNGVPVLPRIQGLQRSSVPPRLLNSFYREVRLSNNKEPLPMHCLPQGATVRQATPSFAHYIAYDIAPLHCFVTLTDGRVGWYRGLYQYNNPCLFIDTNMTGVTSLSGSGQVGRKHDSQSLWSLSPGLPLTFLPLLRSRGELSVILDTVGEDYQTPPKARISRDRPGVASYITAIDGRVVAAAVVYGGCGFTTPPPLSVYPPESWTNPAPAKQTASLEAVIEGPVYDTQVSSGGSGYRCSPEVLFSLDGIPAEATAKMSSGTVTSISIASGGAGYRRTPEIVFSSPGAGASSTATISGFVDYVTITNGGDGYSSAPSVSFTGGGGSGAAGVVIISRSSNGYRVASVVLTQPGTGYSSPPSVSFSGGGGSGAAASATINASLVGLSLTAGGSGYPFNTTASAVGGTAELSVAVSASVESLAVSYSGEYRRNPTISFSNRGHIESISLTSSGSGYSSRPVVGIAAPCGTGATASCEISGSVSVINVSQGGTGYATPPLVELLGGYAPASGRKAKASAVCSGGSVTSIVIDDGGSGYFEQPTVRFVPVSEAILECVVEEGVIRSVTVLSGGYGYASPPTLLFRGGTDASAVATVANGSITSVSVVSGGSGFPQRPTVVIDSGIGTGASAVASISAQVSRVTVLSSGEGFEPGEPVSVFFSGGGATGAGASASASIVLAGSGATATARINGSVVAVKVTSAGAGYQDSPLVYVDSSGSFAWSLPQLGDPRPFVSTRVEGPVRPGVLTGSGEGYTGGDQRYGAIIKGKPAWVQVNDDITGNVISVDLSKAFDPATQYTSPPNLNFGDNVFLSTSISCLTGAFGVKSYPAPPPSNNVYRAQGGDRNTSPDRFRFTREMPVNLSLLGSIDSSRQLFTPYTVTGRVGVRTYEADFSILVPKYDIPPQVNVLDASGVGCVASYSSASGLAVSSEGAGYTLGSTVRMRGGVPSSWVDPPRLSCELDPTSRTLVNVTVDYKGTGCTVPSDIFGPVAAVYARGGGGSGSVSQIGQLRILPSSDLRFEFVTLEAFNRTFDYVPELIVVPFQKPAHRQTCSDLWSGVYPYPVISLNEGFRRRVTFGIKNAIPESVKRQPDSPASISELPSGNSAGQGGEWTYYQHFWNGSVDHVWISPDSDFAPRTIYDFMPSIQFYGNNGYGASAHCEIVGWSDVYSQWMAKRNA
jgi:hypothetical protein